MKTPQEIRDSAWRLLWESRWLNRFAFLVLAFQILRYIAINTATSFLGSSASAMMLKLNSVASVEELRALFSDPAILKGMALIFALSFFVGTVIDGIAMFGLSRVRLKAAGGGSEEGWRKEGFSGLHDPLGMFVLCVAHHVCVWWPMMLAFAPVVLEGAGVALPFGGLAALPLALLCIPESYRYSQTWFLKASHGDWPAVKCLRESSRMMKGRKWQNFLIDCTFWRPVALMLGSMFVALLLILVGGPSMMVLLAAMTVSVLTVYLKAYMPLGGAVFHLEILKSESADEQRRPESEG